MFAFLRKILPQQTVRANADATSLPDGAYTLALTAAAGAKQVATSTRFFVDRTLAATKSAPAFSPNRDGVLDTDPIGFTLVNPAHVEVTVQQGPTVVATLLTADLPVGQQKLTWDGGGLPDGRYTVVVSTTDSLLTVTQSAPVAIDRSWNRWRSTSRKSLTLCRGRCRLNKRRQVRRNGERLRRGRTRAPSRHELTVKLEQAAALLRSLNRCR